jgi:cytochrome P450 family 135
MATPLFDTSVVEQDTATGGPTDADTHPGETHAGVRQTGPEAGCGALRVGAGGAPEVIDGLPPGLRWPAALQWLAMVCRFDALDARVRRFGSLVTLRVPGLGSIVMPSDPQLIKEVFTAERDVMRAGEANAPLAAVLGRNSVLLLDGEHHLRRRRMLLAPFHGEAVRKYAQVVVEVTEDEIGSWPRGEELATWPRMQAITLEVIMRAVMGVHDEGRLERLRPLLLRVQRNSIYGVLAEGARPGISETWLGRRLPWVRARMQAERVLEEEIAAHREHPEGRDDILALLIAARDEDDRPLSDAELRGELLTLLIAGYETTSTVLAWCFERLVRHPRVLSRLQQELAGEDGERYLSAVVDETLRSRPVVDSVQRKLAAPFELGGYRIPTGATVGPSIVGVHSSPEVFEDPRAFRPERFLDGPPAPYTLIPFGGGVRRCIGASFAVMEVKTVLRTVLGAVELQPTTAPAEKPTRGRRIATYPSRGGRIVVRDK